MDGVRFLDIFETTINTFWDTINDDVEFYFQCNFFIVNVVPRHRVRTLGS